MADNTILIDISVKSEDIENANRSIIELSNSIADLKKKRDDLRKAGMLTADAEADINRKLREQNAELKANNQLVNSASGSLAQMKAQLSLTNIARNKLTEAEREGGIEGKRLTAQSSALTEKLKEQESIVGNDTRQVGSYRKVMKELTRDLLDLQMQGKRDTEEYKQKASALGEIKDRMSDISAETKLLGSDTKYIDMFVGSITAVGSAVQIAEGSMQLFGISNDSVERGIQKLVAIQSIMTGVQEVANALQKESAFMMGIVELKTKAATAAQWLWNAAKSAGTMGIGLIIAGLGALTTAIILYTKNTGESADEQERLNNEIVRTNTEIDKNIIALERKNNLDKAAGEDERVLLDRRIKQSQENYYLQQKIAEDLFKLGARTTDKKEEEYTEQDKLLKSAYDKRDGYNKEYWDLTNQRDSINIQKSFERSNELNKEVLSSEKSSILKKITAKVKGNDVILKSDRSYMDEKINIDKLITDRTIQNDQTADRIKSEIRQKQLAEEREAFRTRMTYAAMDLAYQIENATTLNGLLTNTLNVVRDTIKKEISARIAGAIVAQIASVAKTTPWYVVPIVAPLAAAAINGLFEKFIPKFATGGIVPGSSYNGDRVPVLVNSGEVILNKQQQNSIGYNAFKRAGVPGYATGGVAGARNQVQTVLVVEDLSQVTRRMSRTKVASNI